ncbi:uncharacterized protein BDW47DRAFT_134139 [Aspergillus candidus]|uniref:Uncharacterized protein n=1 Tax=Aspergillus candidus TaxID=41067 RepID=A0A2I2FJY8_ASPCN|nr:hypothetical protein BDW47DRAFT_134139 [Aspergillus candidus]PLB40922.1 hypothetical protein BDW47DRAFT_134139 [Aspergillus candidus]
MTISPISPAGLKSSSLKDEITAIWSQVQARVVQLGGGDVANLKPDLDIESVLSLLDRAQQREEEKEEGSGEGRRAVRVAFDTTLRFVETVGGLVAVGAADVFGPSELCFNAISLVIHAWQDYQAAFESLASLLDRCGQYLCRLQYYIRGGMDVALAKVACQHLQLFVEICDRVIKLRHSKRRKLALFAKLFFLNDNEVQELLEKMDGLVDQEGRLVTAQTFNFASEAALGARENLAISKVVNSKVDMLIASKKDQKKESDVKSRREAIFRTLAFDENKLDRDKKEPHSYWQRMYHNYRKSVVPGTGQWVFSDPGFKAWESGQQGCAPVLMIEGVEGSGKSYLASTIIRRLRNRSSVDSSGPRTLLAFYFVEGDSKEELKRTNHIDVIAKSLVWQFVQADVSYTKSVAGICQRQGDLDPHEILEALLLYNEDLDRVIDATFYIVIDGLSDIIGDALLKFLQRVSALSASHNRVRILLTGRPRASEQLSKTQDILFEILPISTRNRNDVEKYTLSKMDQIEALKDTHRLGVPDLRNKICQSLCDKTRGDYFRINTILKHISTLDSVNDIDQVLDDAGKERSEQILAEIEKLNSVRTEKEIEEMNEIILWIIYGRQWFQARQVAAILYQKTGERSLLPLESKLQMKYSLFEVDSDGDIDFRSDEIARLIPERQRHFVTDQTTNADADKRIQPAEVSIIRHFLKTVCPQELYNKFDFEAFFEQKLSPKNGFICRDDKDTAELKLALTCLHILTEERDEKHEILRPYAVSYLLQHLSSVDLALVEREKKGAVGPHLLRLFTDENAVDALIWTNDAADVAIFTWHARAAWLDSDQGAQEILRWFKDSAVIANVSDDDSRAWISNLNASVNPEKDFVQTFAKRMAVHWLRESSPPTLACEAFCFVYDAMRKSQNESDNTEKHVSALEGQLSSHEISEAEDWSRSLLKSETSDSLWEIQVAIVLSKYLHTEEAEKRCRHALELDPSNWRASYHLSHIVSSKEEATDILESITQRLQANSKWMQEPSNVTTLAEMLFDLGQIYWEAGCPDPAIHVYTKSVSRGFIGYERIFTILEHYHRSHRWSEIIALLDTVHDVSTDRPGVFDMLVNLADRESLHDMILQLAVKNDEFGWLEHTYDGAMHLALKDQAYTSLYFIRYHYANALFQHHENEKRAITMWEIALQDDLPRSFLDIEEVLPSLAIKLGPVYLHKARAAKTDLKARKYLHNISNIFPSEMAENNILLPAKLYIARYYQVKEDTVKAKQIVRSIVKMALELLSDKDGDNDFQAYWRLFLVFLPLNDDENAFVAIAMAALARVNDDIHAASGGQGIAGSSRSPRAAAEGKIGAVSRRRDLRVNTVIDHRDDIESSDSQSDIDSLAESDKFAICDGKCGYCWTAASEMWWCKDCINLTFEKECFQQLQEGTHPLNICDKNHEFLHIPSWDREKMDRFQGGIVPRGEEGISLEEWKGEIRKKYVEED